MKKEIENALSFDNKTLFVCIGNSLRGDDGVGPYIAEKLKSKNIKVINAGQILENYIDEIISLKPSKIIIIDAAFFNGKVGEYRILEESKLNSYKLISTHSIPINLLLNIIRQDLLDVKIVILGIQPKNIDYNEQLTPYVKKTADEIVEFILRKNKTNVT